MRETKTLLALKEMMGYLEANDRTERTLELRLLLKEAFAEQQKYVAVDQYNRAIPSMNCEKPDWWINAMKVVEA